MRVAIVHYWLVNWRGGEKVLKALLDIWPEADLYTHVADMELVAREIPGRALQTTFIGRLPRARRWYQRYLPLMPLALEQLDLRAYDLVISCESGPAKGVIVSPGAVHICYCHSPMRYVWDMYHDYRQSAGVVTRVLMAPLLHYMRMWDQLSAQRVDHFVANSAFVARRIEKYYRRQAAVIHPPVAVDRFEIGEEGGKDFYLMVGQLVAYKRPDMAVRAFNELGLPLIVIGDGDMKERLRRMAKANVRILGSQPDEIVREHYQRCRALIFPGTEDFGIVPLEAMACGRPVIAHRSGGALETIVEGVTGLFFDRQSDDALAEAIGRFERSPRQWDSQRIRRHAQSFGYDRFAAQVRHFVNSACGLE